MKTGDIQSSIAEIEILKLQLSRKDEELSLKDEQLERKNERILYLERQLFGRRSEKQLPTYNQAQLSLFDQMQGGQELEQEKGLHAVVEEITKKAEQRHKQKKADAVSQKRSYKIPEHIERVETIIDPENLDLNVVIKIGEDVSERLMLEPSRFWVKKTVRPIYKEKQDKSELSAKILQAPIEPTILPGCIAGSSLLSRIIVDKFLHHIPEYRQVVCFKEFGIDFTTSSINRWVHAVADKLYPLYIAQMESILSSDYIQVDETTLSVKDRPGKTRKAYIWAVRSVLNPAVFFYYDKGSRSGETLYKLLKDYEGAMQSDGYAAYSAYEDIDKSIFYKNKKRDLAKAKSRFLSNKFI